MNWAISNNCVLLATGQGTSFYNTNDNYLLGHIEGAEDYVYDTHGNTITMPYLRRMNWDYADRLQYASLGGGGEVWYVYDASGERVRKVIKNRDIVEDRLYLGGYQSWTKTVNGQVAETRESLHVNDRTKRIAILNGDKKATTIRYQYDNHLGSACLELDDRANIITYEEYHPYTCKSSSKGLCGGATWIEFGIHLQIK